MDVLNYIKKEDEKFRKLMLSIESAHDDKKKNFLREFYADLNRHHEAEDRMGFRHSSRTSKG